MSTPQASRLTPHGIFVTGTDTGVGKTLIACALLIALGAAGKRAVGMKPVAAGARIGEQGMHSEDVERLIAAANVSAPRAQVNPYSFAPAIAPHIAAKGAGVAIDLDVITSAYRELAAAADFVVVEGVGGFRVPLTAREDTADLAQRLGLPLLLIVGMRLGCLNHALLTAEAIRARGLTLAGWCANHIDPAFEYAEENVAALSERLQAPLVGRVPCTPMPDARTVAPMLDFAVLFGMK